MTLKFLHYRRRQWLSTTDRDRFTFHPSGSPLLAASREGRKTLNP
jgi:hypothetical protein